ncbi:cation:proton antiporter [Hoeflea sp. G2-23]|uniref:Cation:proton antiporter n=1 Tax=Hoeflea algicola TaxID=2983763 RepID=A0ABT3ZB45_9HYPH|nr:cation:proton antiporter [Hoeflea algicola]MCY0149022.1 cation:proton antiporter [Hoeflea algicola]
MTDFLLLAFVFLVAGVFAVPIATRLGLGSVLGYLIAGIAISPVLALLDVDVLSIQHFAEFGVVMMLFLVGLELEPKMLWQMRTRLIGLGGAQVAGSTLLVMMVAMALGQSWTVSLAIGLVLSLSSTAIVLQSLNEKGLLKSDGGQSSFSVLLFQDIAVIPMLALIPLLALPELLEAHHAASAAQGSGGGDHGATMSLVAGLNGWQTTLVTLAAVAAVVLIGSRLTRPLFRFIATSQLRELFTATALLMVIGIALLMSLVGLSPALGTFLAGVVLANSEYRHELESDIGPFKGLLLGLFFMSVGAGINFALLADNPGLIVALTLALIAIKAGVLYVLALVFKLRGGDRWLFALGLAQAGEFGFVLLSFTVANSVIPAEIADQLLLVVALSMVLTPGLFILYDRVIAPRFVEADGRQTDQIDEQNHIIIAGHGRMGGLIQRMLSAAGYGSTVIDFNSKRIDMMGRFGLKSYYGDATRPELLHAAGISEAKLIVIAIDDREQITELTRYLQHTHPGVHVLARAVDRDHVYDLWAAGCRDIVRETYDSSIRMGRSAFEALGISTPHAHAMADAFDRMDRKSMLEVASVYDPKLTLAENEPYIQKVREMMGPWRAELARQMEEIRRSDTT